MYETCLFFNLNSFTRAVNKRWEEEFEKLGLSASHGYLLRLVLSKPGSTQKHFAEELGLAPSTVTRFLEALELKGFVKRTSSHEDGRAMAVEPTKKALALSSHLEQANARVAKFLIERLGSKNTEDLVEILRASQSKIDPKNWSDLEEKLSQT
jgi:MarR family transcriptional regulator, organic hydroperoxide resistance regulator